jgi:anhydro-N-acetylmuramic acid kinase
MKPDKPFVAVGQMSGTSRDGLDTVVVEIRGTFPDNTIRLLCGESFPYDRRWRKWLSLETRLDPTALSAARLAGMHFRLGRFFAARALAAIGKAGLTPGAVDAIGCHGQTIYHHPPSQLPFCRGPAWGDVPSTLQAGSGAAIAALTGITAVTDFRSADVAVGGEGAPLVPIYDYVAHRSQVKSRVALNIGGIANLTAIPARAAIGSILSFDTGPGNCLIDTAIGILSRGRQRYDRDGAWARRGVARRATLKAMLKHAYFREPPPKSTGWEEFGVAYTSRIVERMAAAGADRYAIVRTVTEAVAESIARAVDQFVRPRMAPDEVIVTGGGSRNPFLMEVLARRLAPARVDCGEAFGIDSRYKEACAFAYLAYLCLKGIPANIESQRAGRPAVVLGAIYPGRPRGGARRRLVPAHPADSRKTRPRRRKQAQT